MYWEHPVTKEKSHISQGKFHWELFGVSDDKKSDNVKSDILSMRYDWNSLREHIRTFGIRNSLLLATMPTASTSQLLGNNECTEPYTSNVYKRKTLAGEFIVINKHLVDDLYKLKMYNNDMRDYLIACEGSVQNIDGLPTDLKKLYRTAYEINQEELIRQAIDRQPFIDQSQSLNWYMENLTGRAFNKLANLAWKGGLKTGKYYLHSRPSAVPQMFTIDPKIQAEMAKRIAASAIEKSVADQQTMPEECLVCSS